MGSDRRRGAASRPSRTLARSVGSIAATWARSALSCSRDRLRELDLGERSDLLAELLELVGQRAELTAGERSQPAAHLVELGEDRLEVGGAQRLDATAQVVELVRHLRAVTEQLPHGDAEVLGDEVDGRAGGAEALDLLLQRGLHLGHLLVEGDEPALAPQLPLADRLELPRSSPTTFVSSSLGASSSGSRSLPACDTGVRVRRCDPMSHGLVVDGETLCFLLSQRCRLPRPASPRAHRSAASGVARPWKTAWWRRCSSASAAGASPRPPPTTSPAPPACRGPRSTGRSPAARTSPSKPCCATSSAGSSSLVEEPVPTRPTRSRTCSWSAPSRRPASSSATRPSATSCATSPTG